MTADLVITTLNMASTLRKPAGGVIRHSDQGSQYTSLAFGERRKSMGVKPSIPDMFFRRIRHLSQCPVGRLARLLASKPPLAFQPS